MPHQPRKSIASIRVLVVDDHEDSRVVLQEFLGMFVASCDTAGSVEEARAMLASKRYDVVVSDIVMPNEDGYALVRHVKSDAATRTVRVVALTALAADSDRAKAGSEGFDAFVTKPLHGAELLDALGATVVRA